MIGSETISKRSNRKEQKMKVFKGKNVPIKSWCENPEEGALEQAHNLSGLPFIFRQVCLMPDVHRGYGMPIGGVIATKGVVIPNAVGVDIGCGMISVKTNFSAENISNDSLTEVMSLVRKKIPLGRDHHKEKQEWEKFEHAPDIAVVQRELNSARYQLGTLGGGNHFIEIQKGDDGFLWLMIHSGSRNFGFKIAKEYNKIAQDLCTKWYSNIPPLKGEDGLAFLPIDTKEGRNYLTTMNYALEFALENRKRMMNVLVDSVKKVFNCDVDKEINIHHNYAAMENHFGKNVMVHRKGATSAKLGQYGIIPGSQGSSSYIVIGKGERESFCSSSHGAGRKMGRKVARNTLNLAEEQEKLDRQGIIHSIQTQKDLDEASGAYKDIDVVMEEQKDLVEIAVKLSPLAVIKGN